MKELEKMTRKELAEVIVYASIYRGNAEPENKERLVYLWNNGCGAYRRPDKEELYRGAEIALEDAKAYLKSINA